MKKAIVAILILISTLSAFAVLWVQFGHSSPSLKKFSSYLELRAFIEERPYQPRRYPTTYLSFWNPNYLQNFLRTMSILPYRESPYLTGPESFVNIQSTDVNPQFSDTNVQVEGVDEADSVKTDGEYIYVVSNQQIVIVRAYPPEEAAVLSRITVNGTLKQMFINGDRLVVFHEYTPYSQLMTFISVYDVSDRQNPEFKTQISVDGYYFTSRMINDYVYAIAKKQAVVIGDAVTLPTISSAKGQRVVPATDIHYTDAVDYGYVFTTVVSFNVKEDGQQPTDETVLSGYTTSIYASMDNIYLAMTHDGNTVLHRIQIGNGQISYAADGEVSGTVLNQFSMDEYQAYFRIATMSSTTRTNVYILNMNLDVVGKIEGIAPGETMHSARFIGPTGYLVTFRKTDPLFVINLMNPFNPVMLGELKVSGYSDYLHPYDENHVIGVGKETVPSDDDTFSWYQGVKISFFDVANVSDPKELAKYEIGDRGTDSPVLTDHKAFLFDSDKNLLVLPVSVAVIDESKYPYGVPEWAYGEIVWQGAYVFEISLATEEKLALKGTITHVEGTSAWDTSRHISRALYIGNVLYTVSNAQIKMNSLTDLSEIGVLTLIE